jgi:hypothetical protein
MDPILLISLVTRQEGDLTPKMVVLGILYCLLLYGISYVVLFLL